MSITIRDINSAIISGVFTNDDLNSITNALRYARAQMIKQTTRSLLAGERVRFTHPKTGRVHTGVVKKVKIKNVTVIENGLTSWNVPANMLEVL